MTLSFNLIIKSGDILDEPVEILISTANPQLNMSGGVNGAILSRGGEAVQKELKEYLARKKRHYVEPGTIVTTGPGSLSVKKEVDSPGLVEGSRPVLLRLLDPGLHRQKGRSGGSPSCWTH